MAKDTIKQILKKTESLGSKITIQAWVRTKRDTKDLVFIALNDGSCMSNLQVIADKSVISEDVLHSLTTGASCTVSGLLVESPAKEQALELQALSVELLGECPSDYPLQKKRHSFEFLREIGHLRTRTNTFSAVARIRNALTMAVHSFFQEQEFFNVHTPIITASDAEGAGEMFQVTTLPFETFNSSEGIDYSRDFFGKKASLTVSGQLSAETYATALGRVYTFGPTFRAENSNTSRHLAEFWMIEPEMSFCDINGNMDMAEDFLKYVLNYVLENCKEDMEFFNKFIQKGIINDLQEVINSSFIRISYTKAIEDLQSSSVKFEYPVSWGIDLASEHEKYLTEEVYHGPVIITDYPKDIKAFYMKMNDDGKTVRAMDVLVPRLGEIIGGSERENRYDVLLQRIKDLGLEPEDYWWYLDLRKYGSVPHAGFGLGFERLIQYVTGMTNIRDVIPYARSARNCDF
ncbi:asparagine--tRNA ligase [Oceanispirochaeta crateris]|uniref:Asparagine--tRNA ligase n=1 Tax=Oceanispirochaeta crateris TaxID=2518645 RepID=A0A5C1QJY7_9SPIO|nr:asparagine--tRNA ligase [Oceanispirochaeta crateris]QEN07797.1 asparagine--tRNA ligase [Oceanispirochaeta crateris]